MSNPSKKAKTASTSGGPFAKRPREMLVWILQMFSMYEVAQLQRLVCREFRDAGQERIHERGGRKLYEEGIAYFYGLDYKTINKDRGRLLVRASHAAGCKILPVRNRMFARIRSDDEKQKILKDLKEIATSSPYHWVDYYISEWYLIGWGGEEKRKRAVAWLEKAVHNGNTCAMASLAASYDNGDLGLTKSATKANELFALAADKGDAKARLELGYSYLLGSGDLAIDFNRCVALWEQSAKQGVLQAQIELGDIYHAGSGDGLPMTIPVDPQLSFRWSLAAAKQGDVISMKNIGFAYYKGRGVEQNDKSAFEWFMKAAARGDPRSQYMIGRAFEKGRGGVDLDLVKAMHWYTNSAARGFQEAIDAVEDLYHN